MSDRLLSPKEVAEYTGLSYRTVLHAIETADLPASRLRNRLRVSRYDMLAWIDGNAVTPRRRAQLHRPVRRFAPGSLRAIEQEDHSERGSDRAQDRARLARQVA